MATCVRCKKEIEETLKYCPYCGAKQNMYIDVNQVVNKDLIGNNKFDTQKDILKTPKVEIIIDDSEAAKPVLISENQEEIPNLIEDLPTPNIKQADISDYTNDIEIDLTNDNTEEDKVIIEEESVENDTIQNEIIEEASLNPREVKSRNIYVFNLTFNILLSGFALFLAGFPYFYETHDMLFIKILKDTKQNLPNIIHLSINKYISMMAIIAICLALIFYILYIVISLASKKPKYKKLSARLYFGISLSFINIIVMCNALSGLFKLSINLLFTYYSFIIFGITVLLLFVNMTCRMADPLALSFRWGFNRYDLENVDSLPKLVGMNKTIFARKIIYLIIASILMFNIYLFYLDNLASSYQPTTTAYLVSRYCNYKCQYNGFINIFKILKPVTDLLFTSKIYKLYDFIMICGMCFSFMCVIAREFISKKKTSILHKPSLVYILTLVIFMVWFIRSISAMFAILDGAGVNDGIDPLIRNIYIAAPISFLTCFVLMILERCLNKNIRRKQMSIYKEQ